MLTGNQSKKVRLDINNWYTPQSWKNLSKSGPLNALFCNCECEMFLTMLIILQLDNLYFQVTFDYTYIDPGVDDIMSKKSRFYAPKV